ncbi:MAG: HNH endonuclease [Pseudomonadota bacterium]
MSRKAISKTLRFEVFKRDEFTCQYCGAKPPSVVLECDHIVPVKEGGTNDIDNLTTSCFDCNRGKGSRNLTNVPETLASKAERVRERELQLAEYSKIISDRRERIDVDAWRVAALYCEHFDKVEDDGCHYINRKHLSSIKRFLRELSAEDLMEAMEIAIAQRPQSESYCFRYFCGIGWKWIKQGEVTY